MNNDCPFLPNSVKFIGNINIQEEGFSTCDGDGLITSSFFIKDVKNNPAFSFQFIDFHVTEVPIITFGLKSKTSTEFKEDKTLFSYSYFDFLSTFRSSPHPLIPYDGIGVIINMIIENGQFKIFVNNESTVHDSSDISKINAYYFLEIQQKGSCVLLLPFHSANIRLTPSFYPYLLPRFWSCLPFLIQIRDFNVRGNSNLRSVYGELPLSPLPGHPDIKYFEVIIRSISPTLYSKSGIYIGLVDHPHNASDYPPGQSNLSIGFSTYSKILRIAGVDYDFHMNNISSGNVIGLGIHQDDIFLTHNGVICEPSTLPQPSFSQYFPIISVTGSSDEVIINLGQLPFAYEALKPPDGWCLFNQTTCYIDEIEKGPPPEHHIQNFFPFTGLIGSPSYFETIVSSKQLKINGGHFEVTILTKDTDDVIMVGLSASDYVQGSACGCEKKTIAIHSDDGMLFYESGPNGKKNIIDPGDITQGKTIGITLEETTVYLTVNKKQYMLVNDYTYKAFPTISIYGKLVFIANFGESPFVFSNSNCESEGVKLYNGVICKMTNNHLDKVGLLPGDFIEYRDLSLRGIFVGELQNRFYVSIEGIGGAVPLQETNHLVIRSLIRVLYRHSESFIKPIMTFSDCVLAHLGLYDRKSIYASRYGIAFIIGKLPNGNCVMRPIIDLMNNSHCFVLEQMPSNVLKTIQPEIDPTLPQTDFSFLDVVEDGNQSLLLILGSQNGQIVGWNNEEIVPPKSDHIRILFGMNGLAYLCINNILRVNVGMQKGGKYFPPNYYGTAGSQFFQNSTSQRSCGSQGIMPIPPAANLLLTTLNEKFTLNDADSIPSRIPNAHIVVPSIMYDIDDDFQTEPLNLPLITVSKLPE